MRIRSIKPEFWRSDDIAALGWDERLLFVGLWSYVDDNGVGIDRLASIVADLFSGDVEADPRETFARVSRGLQRLSEAGLIARYRVAGKRYLYVTGWAKHQRVDRPNKERYPLPTCEDAEIVAESATPSRHPRETPSSGTGEQGNRGTGETTSAAPAAKPDLPDRFPEFWSLYPRKVKRPEAIKAWNKAIKGGADVEQILAGLRSYLPTYSQRQTEHIPHPATWINGEQWNDDLTKSAQSTAPSALPGETEDQRRRRLRIPEGW